MCSQNDMLKKVEQKEWLYVLLLMSIPDLWTRLVKSSNVTVDSFR